MSLTVSETVTSPDAAAANATVKHDQFNVSKTANSSAPYSVTLTASQEIALVAGAKTIDLTALIGTNLGAVSLDTKKPIWLLIKNKSTNVGGPMTFAKGASNGYTGLGASFSIQIPIGGSILIDLNTGTTTVSSTVKNIDVSGSGTDVIQLCVLA